MAIDPLIARGYQGGVVNAFHEGERHRANMNDRESINTRRNALVDIERQEAQRNQITAQQQQALLQKYSDIQALKKLPPEAAAQWFEQQKAEPNFANTPWANAPAEQAIPAIEQQIAALLGLKEEQPAQAPSLPGEIQRYEYGQKNSGFREYEDRNRTQPQPREPRAPSEWEQYQSMNDEQRALFDKMKGRGGEGGTGVTVGADGQLTVNPASIKASEGERKVAALGVRLEAALRNLENIRTRNPGSDRPTYGEVAKGNVPLVGEIWANKSRSPDRQQADAAQTDALDAALTLATGAAYTKEQFAGLRKAYFPQVGDSEETITFKEQQFNNIVQAARVNAGRAEPTINAALDASGQAKKPAGKNPEVEAVLHPKNGQRGKSKSGKPIIYRNGQWEYE